MEDILTGIAYLFLQICYHIFMAAIRPCKYLISIEYRKELKSAWSGKSKIHFYSYVFYGLVPFILLLAYLIYHFYLKEPEPTKMEQLKNIFSKNLQ